MSIYVKGWVDFLGWLCSCSRLWFLGGKKRKILHSQVNIPTKRKSLECLAGPCQIYLWPCIQFTRRIKVNTHIHNQTYYIVNMVSKTILCILCALCPHTLTPFSHKHKQACIRLQPWTSYCHSFVYTLLQFYFATAPIGFVRMCIPVPTHKPLSLSGKKPIEIRNSAFNNLYLYMMWSEEELTIQIGFLYNIIVCDCYLKECKQQ